MIDGWIHVGIKAIFARPGLDPCGARLFFYKTNFHNRFAALETVFPRHDHADRCAVLIGQHFAKRAQRNECQRVHRFVHAQALGVRPVEHTGAQTRHLRLVSERDEFNKLGIALRLHRIDQRGQRKADPRHHHRPRLDAAEAIDALFERCELEQFFDVEHFRLQHFTFDRNRPRTGFQ